MKGLFVYTMLIILFLLSSCSKAENMLKGEKEFDYAAFLISLYENKSPDEELDFFIKDLDNNEVSELIVAKNGISYITVYTFNDKVVELGNHNFETGTARLFSSDNSSYPGIFSYFEGGGLDHYGYLSIKDNKLVYEELWNEDYSGISGELGISRERIEEISTDKKLINESIRLYKENKDLPFQSLNRKLNKIDTPNVTQTEAGNDMYSIFPHKKGFVWYYEGPNDAEKISMLDDITKKGEHYVLTIKSCREDLTGQ